MDMTLFYCVNEMFDMISWTPYEEKVLIDLLRKFKRSGMLVRNELRGDNLFDITSELSVALGKNISFKKVEKKFKALSNRFEQWKKVFDVQGVKLNGNMLEADEATWDAIARDNPFGLKYKHQPEPLYLELCMVFGMLKREEEDRKLDEFLRRVELREAKMYNANASLYNNDAVSYEWSVIGGYNKHVLPLSTPSVWDPSFGIYKGFVGTNT